MGGAELAAGRVETARSCFLRASNYFRTAGVMLMGTPLDERLVRSNHCEAGARTLFHAHASGWLSEVMTSKG
jgi:hypothetical protein